MLTARQAFAAAVELMRTGKLGRADELCVRILKADPGFADALHLRGLIAGRTGRPDAATRLLEQALRRQPDKADAWNDLGMLLCGRQRPDDAARCFRRAIAIDPRFAAAHVNLASLYFNAGKFALAEKGFREAVRLRPEMEAAHYNLAQSLVSQGRVAEAADAARVAIGINPGNPHIHSVLGNALDRLGQLEDALAAHRQAIALQPEAVAARLEFAGTLANHGRIDEAVSAYREVLARDPDNVLARFKLARLVRYEARDSEVEALAALAGRNDLSNEDAGSLNFALGKVLEDIEDHDGAFGSFVRANAFLRRDFSYSTQETARAFADIRAAFSPEVFERFEGAGNPDPTPIFVVGLPRSGTSLVEQILSSHPEVVGAGELVLVEEIGQRLCRAQESAGFQAMVRRVSGEALCEAGREYVEQIRAYSGTARHIVDKLPGNFLYIGLIRLMLPAARIVHIRRDPLENALSLFKNRFGSGSLAFSYDFDELAHYIRHYQEMMEHWRSVLPGATHDIFYEDLVGDQERETRRLLDSCGLDWSDACLRFFETERPVHTASLAQVRQPIHAGSLKLSQRYGDVLEPLRRALGDAGVAYTYDRMQNSTSTNESDG